MYNTFFVRGEGQIHLENYSKSITKPMNISQIFLLRFLSLLRWWLMHLTRRIRHLSIHLYGRKYANVIARIDSSGFHYHFPHDIDKCPEMPFAFHVGLWQWGNVTSMEPNLYRHSWLHCVTLNNLSKLQFLYMLWDSWEKIMRTLLRNADLDSSILKTALLGLQY